MQLLALTSLSRETASILTSFVAVGHVRKRDIVSTHAQQYSRAVYIIYILYTVLYYELMSHTTCMQGTQACMYTMSCASNWRLHLQLGAAGGRASLLVILYRSAKLYYVK